MKVKQLALSFSHVEGSLLASTMCPSSVFTPSVVGWRTHPPHASKCLKSAATAGFHFMLFTFLYVCMFSSCAAPQTIWLLLWVFVKVELVVTLTLCPFICPIIHISFNYWFDNYGDIVRYQKLFLK